MSTWPPRAAPAGVISSIDTYDGVENFESHLTTPEPLELQKHFANALSSGLGYLVMEVVQPGAEVPPHPGHPVCRGPVS